MQNNFTVIVGSGLTGLSCAHFLTKHNVPFALNDTRPMPPDLAIFKKYFPDASVALGKLDEELLNAAHCLVVSPGVSTRHPLIAAQKARGVPVIGDIELFAQHAKAPVIAITGTNAKSTVTTLVGLMAEKAGIEVGVGGNLGVPALDLLSNEKSALYVLELSSFQLETTYSLRPHVATVLNVTPDHMDRYHDLADYARTKQHIYQGCQVAVCNRDDVLTHCDQKVTRSTLNFTLNAPGDEEFGLLKHLNEYHLAFENRPLLPVAALPVQGRHYQANALAALAIGQGFGLPMSAMLDTLTSFKGLPHRCQWTSELNGVIWYNDSKGTNVGATLAAIEGLGATIQGKLVLIAGGVGKNADFSPLILPIEKYARSVILIGEAAPILANVLGDRVSVQMAASMEEAVRLARLAAQPGDSVLLSPACASLDMFKNFEHRGEVFTALVKELK